MRVLGIIPARGGSKGIKGKNLLEIEGRTLLAYAIEAGKKSKLLSNLVVSTEDEKIASASKENNCKVLKRPVELASDTANVVDTVLDVVSKLEGENNFFDAVLLLQPTAPLRTESDIDASIEILRENSRVDAVISVVPVEDTHPARMYRFEDGKLISEVPELEAVRRQDLPKRYIRNGCLYLIRTEVLKREKTFMPSSKSPYIMNPEWAVNIDSNLDVVILKALMKRWKELH